MSVTFADAVANLKAMFPEWDDEMLGDVIVSNGYNVERSIETILTLSGEGDSEKGPGNPGAESESADKGGDIPYAAPQPKAPRPATRPAYRGKRIKLPDTFLRSPGAEFKQAISQDEELARMLQNELFREEVKKTLGKDALKSGKAGEETSMLKIVSNMGAVAKKNLLGLANSFKGSGSSNSKGVEMGSYSEDSQNSNDAEYIFDNKARGNQHMLDGGMDGAENPLLGSSNSSGK